MEWKDCKPPVAPTFSTQIARAFFNSVDNLVTFGQALLLLTVALTPWLPVIVIGILVACWVLRATRNASRGRPLSAASTRPTGT